jgi:hypothetical protein
MHRNKGMTFDLPELRSLAEDLVTLKPADAWQSAAQGMNRHLRRLAAQLKRGEITPEEWRRKMDSFIRIGHVEAHLAGQKMAGIEPYSVEAQRIARIFGDQESQYLQGFLQDIKDGIYLDDDGVFREGAFNARQTMYVQHTRGTAYDGFVYGSAGSSFNWVLGAVEDHCEDCPILAAGGPYTVESLYTYPSMGDTPCLVNCKCFLRRDDGVTGPMPFGVQPS